MRSQMGWSFTLTLAVRPVCDWDVSNAIPVRVIVCTWDEVRTSRTGRDRATDAEQRVITETGPNHDG